MSKNLHFLLIWSPKMVWLIRDYIRIYWLQKKIYENLRSRSKIKVIVMSHITPLPHKNTPHFHFLIPLKLTIIAQKYRVFYRFLLFMSLLFILSLCKGKKKSSIFSRWEREQMTKKKTLFYFISLLHGTNRKGSNFHTDSKTELYYCFPRT